MDRVCFNCGAKERLIYWTKHDKYVCTTCYEFRLPKEEVTHKEIKIKGGL